MTFFIISLRQRLTNNKRKRSLLYLFWIYLDENAKNGQKFHLLNATPPPQMIQCSPNLAYSMPLEWRTKIVYRFLRFWFFCQILGHLYTILILSTKIHHLVKNGQFGEMNSVFSIIGLFSIISLITRAKNAKLGDAIKSQPWDETWFSPF